MHMSNVNMGEWKKTQGYTCGKVSWNWEQSWRIPEWTKHLGLENKFSIV
jgi:hypothetical protein